jgi:hypothetical protein
MTLDELIWYRSFHWTARFVVISFAFSEMLLSYNIVSVYLTTVSVLLLMSATGTGVIMTTK